MTNEDATPHVGKLIRAALDDRHLSQRYAALMMGISAKHLNRIIQAESGISAELALKFERLTGYPAKILMRMQADHQVEIAILKELLRKDAG